MRPVDPRHFASEVAFTFQVYNSAWEKNWGFVPVGEKEFRHMAKDLKMVIHGDLALVADTEGGLRLIDIGTPAAPVEIGFHTSGIPISRAYEAVPFGDYALVADWYNGLRAIDISTPTSPQEVGGLPTDEEVDDDRVAVDE